MGHFLREWQAHHLSMQETQGSFALFLFTKEIFRQACTLQKVFYAFYPLVHL